MVCFCFKKPGAPRGGRGYNDPGAHEGAHGLQEGRRLQRAHKLERGPIEMALRNQHVKPEDLFFFFEITLFVGPNYSIFFVYAGLHKTGNPSYLSWPWAHFWSPATLQETLEDTWKL